MNSDANCAVEFGTTAPGIALHRNFDSSPVAFKSKGGKEHNQIVEFADRHIVPLLIPFGDAYIDQIFGKEKASIVMFTETVHPEFEKAAEQMRGEL